MPIGTHQVVIDVPINVIWNFVKDMDNWAPLVPGYIRHEKLHNRQSIWEFKVDMGLLKKKVTLMVNIKEWNEPARVSFDLKGMDEKYTGNGYFEAKSLNQNQTRLTGFIEINAGGPMEGMKNSLMKTSVQQSVEEMALAISAKLQALPRRP